MIKNPSILFKSLDEALEQLRDFQLGSRFMYKNNLFILQHMKIFFV